VQIVNIHDHSALISFITHRFEVLYFQHYFSSNIYKILK
jgi:hypothetical protein